MFDDDDNNNNHNTDDDDDDDRVDTSIKFVRINTVPMAWNGHSCGKSKVSLDKFEKDILYNDEPSAFVVPLNQFGNLLNPHFDVDLPKNITSERREQIRLCIIDSLLRLFDVRRVVSFVRSDGLAGGLHFQILTHRIFDLSTFRQQLRDCYLEDILRDDCKEKQLKLDMPSCWSLPGFTKSGNINDSYVLHNNDRFELPPIVPLLQRRQAMTIPILQFRTPDLTPSLKNVLQSIVDVGIFGKMSQVRSLIAAARRSVQFLFYETGDPIDIVHTQLLWPNSTYSNAEIQRLLSASEHLQLRHQQHTLCNLILVQLQQFYSASRSFEVEINLLPIFRVNQCVADYLQNLHVTTTTTATTADDEIDLGDENAGGFQKNFVPGEMDEEKEEEENYNRYPLSIDLRKTSKKLSNDRKNKVDGRIVSKRIIPIEQISKLFDTMFIVVKNRTWCNNGWVTMNTEIVKKMIDELLKKCGWQLKSQHLSFIMKNLISFWLPACDILDQDRGFILFSDRLLYYEPINRFIFPNNALTILNSTALNIRSDWFRHGRDQSETMWNFVVSILNDPEGCYEDEQKNIMLHEIASFLRMMLIYFRASVVDVFGFVDYLTRAVLGLLEKKIIHLSGSEANNGKSFILDTMYQMLKGRMMPISTNAINGMRRDTAPDIVKARHACIVFLDEETNQGNGKNNNDLKRVVGGATSYMRTLYESGSDVKVNFTLMTTGNGRFQLHGDHGLAIRVSNFEMSICLVRETLNIETIMDYTNAHNWHHHIQTLKKYNSVKLNVERKRAESVFHHGLMLLCGMFHDRIVRHNAVRRILRNISEQYPLDDIIDRLHSNLKAVRNDEISDVKYEMGRVYRQINMLLHAKLGTLHEEYYPLCQEVIMNKISKRLKVGLDENGYLHGYKLMASKHPQELDVDSILFTMIDDEENDRPQPQPCTTSPSSFVSIRNSKNDAKRFRKNRDDDDDGDDHDEDEDDGFIKL